MSGEDGRPDGETDGTGSAPVPVKWWRSPAFVASVTAVVVAVVGGWLQQGGVSLLMKLTESEPEPKPPIVTAKGDDDPSCNQWLWRKDPWQVAEKLTSALSKRGRENRDDVINRTLTTEGGDLPTGRGVQITVQGADQKAVVLTGLDITVERHERRLPGTLVSIGEQCGSGMATRVYSVDLDARKPKPRLMVDDPDAESPEDLPLGFPYKVAAGDPEQFLLLGNTTGYATWTAHLTWVSGGKSGETVISNEGKPFASFTNTTAQTEYWYDVEGQRLEAPLS
ncbi:hypothetical protein ACWD25_19000 [Streptomyces sp. NPDC002920]